MQFGLSGEQLAFQASVSRYLEDAGGLELARQAGRDGAGNAVLTRGLADLGVLGLVVPEAFGGAGLSLLDAALMAETLGAHVAPAPFVGSAVMATLALTRAGSPEQQAKWLPEIAAGTTVAGVALSEVSGARDDAGVEVRTGRLHGRAIFVLDFDADLYVVADRDRGLHLLPADAPGLQRTRLSTVDVTRSTGELRFDGVEADPLSSGDGPAVVRAMLDAGRVMLAADTLGAAQSMLDQAVAYAKQREQFGRAIASFQAVKHMCAEMAAAIEPCRALVWYAAHALDHLPAEASVTACHAKAHLSEVGTAVAKTATEVHGGMGFTDLLGLHYWFKRIGFNRQLLGGPTAIRADAARLQGLGR